MCETCLWDFIKLHKQTNKKIPYHDWQQSAVSVWQPDFHWLCTSHQHLSLRKRCRQMRQEVDVVLEQQLKECINIINPNKWNTQICTCTLHMLNAHLNKIRHRSAFSLTQGSQTAAKHLIWEQRGGLPEVFSNRTLCSLCRSFTNA